MKNEINTDRKVENASVGKHYLGDGLILRVRKSGSRDFALRVTIDGQTVERGLGGFSSINLTQAKAKASNMRLTIKQGTIPDKKTKKVINYFKDVAAEYIKIHEKAWKGNKSHDQWHSSLKNYAYKVIGNKPVDKITNEDILKIINPIWTTKHETACRVRGRIEKILDYAHVKSLKGSENPARWQGYLKTIMPRVSSSNSIKHFPAMDYRDLPQFWSKLVNMDGNGALALRWTILTVARSGETRGATFNEIKNDIWVVPAERMKAGKEHRVPLVESALAAIPKSTDESNKLLFPAPRGGRLSDMSISAVLKRMGVKNVTVHGFRSTFRDWAGESTSHPREVIEFALAHRIKDKAEAAYARSDLLAKRKKLMEDWANFVEGKNDE